jgi:peptide/nickel transport system permease protein
MAVNERLQSPSIEHLFGTDHAGRDMLSRVMVGAKTSIYVGVLAVLISSVVGATVGVTSAYFGGKYDLVVQRFVDVLQALPGLILALALMAALGASLNNVVIAITVTSTAGKIRVIRSAALGVLGMQYVDAARAIGASDRRIMVVHILNNSLAPLIIVATAALGGAILAESSLSFLGLGVPPPHASWGRLVAGSREWAEMAPWLLIFPGLALTLTVYGFNVLGDALRDIWDPRLRGS